jgi:hypothetical protein
MKRRLSTLSAFLSLLLCAATIVLWVRSYFGSDYISRNTPVESQPHFVSHHGYSITITRGSIRLASEYNTYISIQIAMNLHPIDGAATWTVGRLGVGHIFWGDLEVRSFWNRLGFHSFHDGISTSFSESTQDGIAIPAWLPTLLFAIAPLLIVHRIIRNRRCHKSGLCPQCGYDIRATPTRCPECGQTIANQSAQTPSDQSDSPGSNPAY